MSLPPPPVRVDPRSIALFLLIAFGLAWGVEIAFWAAGIPLTVSLFIATYAPAAGALVTRAVLREGFADIGWRVPHVRWFAIAWAVPVLVAAAGGIVALITRIQPFHLIQGIPIAAAVVGALVAGPFVTSLFTVGEEIGWRGHLLLRLLPLGSGRAAIITGVIWGLWHAPVIWLYGYNYPGHGHIGAIYFCLFTVPTGVFVAWLRLRTGSIWPGTFAHSSINTAAGFPVLLLARADSLIGLPAGLLAIVPWAVVAIFFARRLEPDRERLHAAQHGAGAPAGLLG